MPNVTSSPAPTPSALRTDALMGSIQPPLSLCGRREVFHAVLPIEARTFTAPMMVTKCHDADPPLLHSQILAVAEIVSVVMGSLTLSAEWAPECCKYPHRLRAG